MPWTKPHIEDISMSSEIGEYQDDFGDDPRFVERAASPDELAERQENGE